MSWQKIELNMIPDTKVLPVVHASQFDSNRSISFQMFTGEDEWTIPEGLTIELHCRKVDDNIVTLAPSSVDGSVITFITTEQLTACSGQNKCELSFIDSNDLVIGSLNFILDVEPDPLKGGLTSASSIYDLTHQIEDIAEEVIGEDYYNKTETDALLADKADISDIPDMSNYYTKTQTDNLLYGKADRSDLTDLASKAEVTQAISDEDTAVKNWVSSHFATPGYVAMHYYSKLQVDDIILGLMPVGSASGNPCTFDTEIAAELQALTSNIVCGGGGGTPSSPIPIVGHSALNLDVNGNTFTVQFGQTVYGGFYNKSGRLTITFVGFDMGTAEFGRGNRNHDDTGRIFSIVKSDAKPASNSTIMADCFKYNGYQGVWENLNVGDIEINSSKVIILCANCETVEELQQTFNGRIIAYELATPIVIDVPSISVFAEVGTNNIVSDCGGDVYVSYKDTIQHYIEQRL